MNSSCHHLPKWAHTSLGTPLELHSSHTLEHFPKHQGTVLIGGVHGDEPEGVELAQKTLNWLLGVTNKPQPEGHFDLNPWVVIPCLNPDGYVCNQRVNSRGVDLNRNFPSRSWSRTYKEPRYNPGPSPASEPEVQALVTLIQILMPRLIVHCHSWRPCLVWSGPNNDPRIKILSQSCGYPIQSDIGYATPGSLSEWAWVDRGLPVLCIEENEGTPLTEVWPRFQTGIPALFSN